MHTRTKCNTSRKNNYDDDGDGDGDGEQRSNERGCLKSNDKQKWASWFLLNQFSSVDAKYRNVSRCVHRRIESAAHICRVTVTLWMDLFLGLTQMAITLIVDLPFTAARLLRMSLYIASLSLSIFYFLCFPQPVLRTFNIQSGNNITYAVLVDNVVPIARCTRRYISARGFFSWTISICWECLVLSFITFKCTLTITTTTSKCVSIGDKT